MLYGTFFRHSKSKIIFKTIIPELTRILNFTHSKIGGNDCQFFNCYRFYLCIEILHQVRFVTKKQRILFGVTVFRENWRILPISFFRGARWLSGRVSDSGARGPGFETYLRRVVSLSKTLYSPKVLVNYPGSDGSVPTWLKNCWLGR